MKIGALEKNEILRYLGYKGGEYEKNLDVLIDECIQKVIELSEPRFVYRFFEIAKNKALELSGTSSSLKGKDIKKHLEDCERCVLMAATLGTKIEREIRMAQVSDMTKTIILDCCASTAIEQVCDKVQEDIEAEVKASGGFITSRYSPGYGDMPIEQQKDFVALLDTHRKIGLTATKNNILTPRKSVTAVIGISKTMIKNTKRDCETCNFKDKCMYRKEGRSCGN